MKRGTRTLSAGRASPAGSDALRAAALQDHWLRMNHVGPISTNTRSTSAPRLPNIPSRSSVSVANTAARNSSTTHGNIASQRPSLPAVPKARTINKVAVSKRNPADEGFDDDGSIPIPKAPELSLAQKMGLVPAPPKENMPVTQEEWQAIRRKALERGDYNDECPICKEEFRNEKQVLLSCSHVFHRDCLTSFEKYSKTKSCPICRKERYQKRLIRDGAMAYEEKCAIKIQAYYRGYRVRKIYRPILEKIPPKDPTKRRDFYAKRIGKITDQILVKMDAERDALDALFDEIDRSVKESKAVFELDFRNYSKSWDETRKQALDRGITDCPICIGTFSESKRPITLLSCSHVFHKACIDAFEKFNTDECHTCPVCRCPYKKAPLFE